MYIEKGLEEKKKNYKLVTEVCPSGKEQYRGGFSFLVLTLPYCLAFL